MCTPVEIKFTVLYGTLQSPLVHMLGPQHIFPSPRHLCVFHKCHVPDLNITYIIAVQTKISSINCAVASYSDFEKKKFVLYKQKYHCHILFSNLNQIKTSWKRKGTSSPVPVSPIFAHKLSSLTLT